MKSGMGEKIAWSFARQWHFSVFQGVTTNHDNIILIANILQTFSFLQCSALKLPLHYTCAGHTHTI